MPRDFELPALELEIDKEPEEMVGEVLHELGEEYSAVVSNLQSGKYDAILKAVDVDHQSEPGYSHRTSLQAPKAQCPDSFALEDLIAAAKAEKQINSPVPDKRSKNTFIR